jgi:hypothetical protein
VPTYIYIYCPTGTHGLSRDELEEELTLFFGDTTQDVGAGSGAGWFNLDYELVESSDPASWIEQLAQFLENIEVGEGTFFEVCQTDQDNEVFRQRVNISSKP